MHFVVPIGRLCYNLEVKVLQCIRILETSPVMTKLISALFLSSNAAPLGEAWEFLDGGNQTPVAFRHEAAMWAALRWTWTLLGGWVGDWTRQIQGGPGPGDPWRSRRGVWWCFTGGCLETSPQATLKKRWMHWVTKRGKILGVWSSKIGFELTMLIAPTKILVFFTKKKQF